MSSAGPFPVKRVRFGRLGERAVLLQDENGPCPLLALANALLLLGRLHVPPEVGAVDASWLQERLAVYIGSAAGAPSAAPEEMRSNLQHLVNDVISGVLPSLAKGRGLDVNPFFSGADSFEFTPALSVFDLCGLKLLHGLIVDSDEDAEAAEAAKGLSYDRALDLIVRAIASPVAVPPASSGSSMSALPTFSPGALALLAARAEASAGVRKSASGEGGVANEAASLPLVPRRSAFLIPDDEVAGDIATEAAAMAAEGGAPLSASQTASSAPSSSPQSPCSQLTPLLLPPLTPPKPSAPDFLPLPEAKVVAGAGDMPSQPPSSSSSEERARALVLQAWLNRAGASHTFAGLAAIYAALEEKEVAVLFHNAHFSVVHKRGGRLLTLVTDVGYATSNAVWATLDGVDGDAIFLNGAFEETSAGSPSAAVLAAAASGTSPCVADARSCVDDDADADLAQALQASREEYNRSALQPAATIAQLPPLQRDTATEASPDAPTRAEAPAIVPSHESKPAPSPAPLLEHVPAPAPALAPVLLPSPKPAPAPAPGIVGNRNDRYAAQAAKGAVLAAQRAARQQAALAAVGGADAAATPPVGLSDAQLAQRLHQLEAEGYVVDASGRVIGRRGFQPQPPAAAPQSLHVKSRERSPPHCCLA